MSFRKNYCRESGISGLPRWSVYRLVGKRLFDLAVSLPLCIASLPVLCFTAVLVRLDSRGPAFYLQQRLGRYGRTFLTYKFRTMTHRDRVSTEEVLPGHSEVTRVGQILRRFKIDELPQLFNILKGEMSLVGPRPALPDHIHDYDGNGLRRLLERPGMTGLAQVNGNIYLSWPERWFYDARYVDSLSVAGDMRIIARTLSVVFRGEESFLNRPALTSGDSVTECTQVDPSDDIRHAA
ncbi:MAG: sugar transferase [Planctomycetaceae bacterium]